MFPEKEFRNRDNEDSRNSFFPEQFFVRNRNDGNARKRKDSFPNEEGLMVQGEML